MDSDQDMDCGMREDPFELSTFKTTEWTPSNDLKICKKTNSGGIYRVFVEPETCKAIANKQAELLAVMEKVKAGKMPNPTNVVMWVPNKTDDKLRRIVQVSVFCSYPKFGIHKLNERGHIVQQNGLNLSPDEFKKLLTHLEMFPAIVKGEQPLTIVVKAFAWKWEPFLGIAEEYGEEGCPPTITDAEWYITHKKCFIEAMQLQPEGSYNLKIDMKGVNFPIGYQLVDAVVGSLIIQNIDTRKVEESMRNFIPESDGDFEMDCKAYGPQAFKEINELQIYKVICRLIKMSENPSADLYASAMSMVAQRGKQEIVLKNLIKKGITGECLDFCLQLTT